MVCRVVTDFCNFLHVFWDTSYTRLLVPLSVFMHKNHCLKQVKQLSFHYSCGSILCSSWLIVECVKTIFVFVIVLMSCPGWFLGLDEKLAGMGGANTFLQDLTKLCQQDKVCTKAHLRRRTLEFFLYMMHLLPSSNGFLLSFLDIGAPSYFPCFS
jgi:hypothetical protein